MDPERIAPPGWVEHGLSDERDFRSPPAGYARDAADHHHMNSPLLLTLSAELQNRTGSAQKGTLVFAGVTVEAPRVVGKRS